MKFLKSSVASPQSDYLLVRDLCSVAAQERQIQALVGVRGHVLGRYTYEDRGRTQLRAGLETGLWLWGGNEVKWAEERDSQAKGRTLKQQPRVSSTSTMALWLLVSDPQGLLATKFFPDEHNTLGSLSPCRSHQPH